VGIPARAEAMALISGTDLDRHNPDHPPGPLIGLAFAAEAAHTTTTRAFVLWLLGGIFTPHLSNMPDTLATIARRCPPTAASATVVRTAWTPCRAAGLAHVAPSVVVAYEQTPDASSSRRGPPARDQVAMT